MKFVLDDLIALADFYCADLDNLNSANIHEKLRSGNCYPIFGIANFVREGAPSHQYSLNNPKYLAALKKGISTLEEILESESKNSI